MAITIKFDTDNIPEKPTLVLGKRNGDKICQISNIDNIKVRDCLVNAPEISFTVHKYDNDKLCECWDEIKDFRLVWCKEWDMWFQLTIDVNISDEVTKNVELIRLAESELSQINLYNVEINTELDIARDEYTEPTILYNAENHDASLLHRILEKAPHYSISKVDLSIAKIQRTFSFDGTNIVDALNEICEEINALVVYDSGTDENGKIKRQISLYDLESNCNECGYRGEYTDICPQCGSKDIKEGYGDDTTICIDDERGLGDDITLNVDTDSVKNCFKLVAGDDLMTATVINCNPNGTAYIWYLSDDFKNDMSDELQNKINEYNALYEEYRKTKQFEIPTDILDKYNALVDKYKVYNQDLENIANPIIGYPNLMNAYYNTIDLNLYLESGLMPSLDTEDITATNQAEKLTSTNLSPISMSSINNLTITTANSAVLGIAKLFVHPSYKVSINQSSLSGTTWTGDFKVENFDDEEDVAYSNTINIVIDDNYNSFISQKLKKMLNGYYEEFKTDISSLFKKDLVNFKGQITKYSLNGLTSLYDACQSCLDIMIEQGVSSDTTTTLYNSLYLPYYEKLQAITDEIKVRENELNIVNGLYNENEKGLQNYIDDIRNDMQNTLNFEKYIGTDLWTEFCSFRREDTYENSNYISDGLDNASLFKQALEFIETAQKDIYKSANLQHKITSSLKNLLVIKEFRPLVKYFSCGNWIRVKIDNDLYKLRLLEYTTDFDNLDSFDVEFSDVTYGVDGLTDTKNVLDKASSMATSYDSVKRQASQGADSNIRLDDWVRKGLDATTVNIVNRAVNQTQSWDKHGMLYRQYDDVTDSYLDTQLKIINQGLYITDNNWKTTRTGIGAFTYLDPKDKKYKEGYGVIADTICSNLILSEEVGIYNADSSIVINKDGISISDPNDLSTDKPSVTITPDGKLTCNGATISGNIIANSLTLTPNAIGDVVNEIDDYFVPFDVAIRDNSGNEYYFQVNSNGLLQAENAHINGTIYSSQLKSCTIDVSDGINFFAHKVKVRDEDNLYNGDYYVDVNSYLGSIHQSIIYEFDYGYNAETDEYYIQYGSDGKPLVAYRGSVLSIDTTYDFMNGNYNDKTDIEIISGNSLSMSSDIVSTICSGFYSDIKFANPDLDDGIFVGGSVLIDTTGIPNEIVLEYLNMVREGCADYSVELTNAKFDEIIASFTEAEKESFMNYVYSYNYHGGIFEVRAENSYIKSETIYVGGGIYYDFNYREYPYRLSAQWADYEDTDTYHHIIERRKDGLTCVFGWSGYTDYEQYQTLSVLRGNSVRLACGGVDGGTGTNATVSDKRILLFGYNGTDAYFRPTKDSATYLGSTNWRWKTVYTDSINASSTSYLGTSYFSGACYYGSGSNYYTSTYGNSVLNTVKVSDSYRSSGFMNFISNIDSTYHSHTVQLFREQSGDNRTVFRPEVSGSAYIGTNTYRWNTIFCGTLNQTSDLKQKNIIDDFDFKAKDFIMSLQPTAYTKIGEYDGGKRIHLGFIAQYLSQNIKDNNMGDLSMVQASIVNDDGTETPYYGEEIDDSKLSWGINYNELIAPIVKLLQEQQMEIDSLKREIESLKQM